MKLGKTPTLARWIRNFVCKHSKYNKDSIINEKIAGDLILAITDISKGKKTYEDFM